MKTKDSGISLVDASDDLKDLKIQRIPVHEQVFDSLKKAIREGRWKVGEKIPTEIELSKAFAVNRLTVRMALQRLSAMGLLESRVGDGTYVKAFNFGEYIEQTKDFYLSADMLDKVMEYRETLEVKALALAVERAVDDELKELDEICCNMENARMSYVKTRKKQYLENFLEADITYHGKLCQMSHNELFVYAYDVCRPLLYEYMKKLISERSGSWVRKGLNPDPDMHRRVCDALMSRDLGRCMSEYANIIDYQVEY